MTELNALEGEYCSMPAPTRTVTPTPNPVHNQAPSTSAPMVDMSTIILPDYYGPKRPRPLQAINIRWEQAHASSKLIPQRHNPPRRELIESKRPPPHSFDDTFNKVFANSNGREISKQEVRQVSRRLRKIRKVCFSSFKVTRRIDAFLKAIQ